MERRDAAMALFQAALEGVNAERATRAALAKAAAEGVRLDDAIVLAVGKAARGMTEAALDVTRARRGAVIGVEDGVIGPLTMRRGGHPLPSVTAPDEARAWLAKAEGLGEADVVLCLLSGGGSALLEWPVDGVSMDALRVTTQALLRAGARIEELNTVRRALSRIKGGRLAERLWPAQVINVILSDVPGASPAVVASGPTLPPPAYEDARAILDRYGLRGKVPTAIAKALERPAKPPPASVFERVRTYVAADNLTARSAMIEAGARLSLTLSDADGYVSGEAREAGTRFYRAARERCRREGLDGIVGGGETTVTVRGDGVGGRNQEFVLGAAGDFEGGLLGSLGTDGIVGASEAAGALFDEGVSTSARAKGLSPAHALTQNDADTFFAATSGRIVTGKTGTNVADVCLYLE